MERVELLKKLSFGSQVAEDETNELARYFVETHQWAKIAKGDIDIVRGDKGAGKSAIYSLLIDRQSTFFDNRILLISAENPRGATVFRDLTADPPVAEGEFIILWKLYILALVCHTLRDYDIRTKDTERALKALEDANLLEREHSLSGFLRRAQRYARNLFSAESIEGGLKFDSNTGVPVGLTGKIVLREPTTAMHVKDIISIDELLRLVNAGLREYDLKVWILFDRLDVAFIENHTLEANALRALVRVYGDLRGLEMLSLKIFLREDIWKRIMDGGFREASHITRYDNLRWNQQSLLNLLMKRILSNKIIADEFAVDAAAILQDTKKQEEFFETLFPKQVEQGPQKATTFNWMITRCADATKQTAPRELIHLLKCIKDQEIKRLENGGRAAADRKLFDRSVFKEALPTVSDARLTQYLYAEYPALRPFVEKLDGQKAEQTADSLADLWGMSRSEAIAKATELGELGFCEARGTKEEPSFWVPFLYRDALHLIQGRAET